MKKIIYLSFLFFACNTHTGDSEAVNMQQRNNVDKDLKSPLSIIENEIIKKPQSPNVYLKRALYFQQKKEFPKALEDINRALLLAPDVSILKYHKAAILYENSVFTQDISLLDESKIYLDDCITNDLEIIPPRLLRSKIYFFEKKTDESIRLVNDVLKIDKNIAEAYLIKGMVYHYLGNYNLASSSYQTAIEVDPEYYDAYISMGMLKEKLLEKDALDYYNSAISIKPNSLEAHRNKGLFLHFNEEYKTARESFKKVKNIDPSFEEAFYNIGNTFLGEYNLTQNEKLVDSAFYYYTYASKMNEKYVQAIHNIGVCYEIKGETDLARSYFKKAIDLDNNFSPSIEAMNSLD
jgi:tetratricopeptide (TPR) repeat protein